MLYRYNTERLELNILSEDAASLTTDFFVRNRHFFEPFEPAHSEEYYTLPYQRRVLAAESTQLLKSQAIRYFLFLKDNSTLIGTVSFQHIRTAPAASCEVGYRLDQAYTGQGFMTEALAFLIPKICLSYHLNRIEANIMPENTASCRLVERLGFTLEGTARGYFLIQGQYRDHYRYSWLVDDPLLLFQTDTHRN
ncbi:MAG: GNAT family N-acetyltransferase [Lachnospiraceae bacterium]|nr:GNAT family N-acetyltransferase [Lachnospiraceae bacterium]